MIRSKLDALARRWGKHLPRPAQKLAQYSASFTLHFPSPQQSVFDDLREDSCRPGVKADDAPKHRCARPWFGNKDDDMPA